MICCSARRAQSIIFVSRVLNPSNLPASNSIHLRYPSRFPPVKPLASHKSASSLRRRSSSCAITHGVKVFSSSASIQTRARGSRSSTWEESAERYFSRKGEGVLEEKGNGERELGRAKIQEVEVVIDRDDEEDMIEKDNELVDDPRWTKIKSRYTSSVGNPPRREFPEALWWNKRGDSWAKVRRWSKEEGQEVEVGRWNKQEDRRVKVRRWNKEEDWGRKTWREASGSTVPKMVGQAVYGVGPILAALTVSRREFYALYVQEGLDLSVNSRKKKDKKAVENVLKMAEKIGLKIVEASKHDLNMVVDSRPHQGLVLDASPLEMVSINELGEASMGNGGKAPLWVALDEVTDPQNLGAIVRSAYFFGVEGIVLCAKNSAPLSGVVSKASAGSLELIELRCCKNMMQFLLSSVDNGWRVLGGSVSSKALPLGTIESGLPTILVLGNEGSGLRRLVELSCTHLVRIPGSVLEHGNGGEHDLEESVGVEQKQGQELSSFLAVESLNVSVAAGVLLYHLIGSTNFQTQDEHLNTLSL